MPAKRSPRRVFGYARVSSAEQALGTSLQDQQAAIRAYARSLGLEVEQMFVEAESAVHEKLERREQIQALMRDVRAGDLVLCDKIDRWSRDPEFTYRSVREILAAGASFFAVGDSCDPSTPDGDTMLNFRVLFAREEHKRIRQRMVGTRNLLRDRGFYASGPPPYGYRRQDVKGPQKNALIPHEGEAARVREIYRLCIQGRSLSDIAAITDLTRDIVARALGRRTYLGEVRNAAGEWIRGAHEPILDARTFVAAQESLRGRRLGWSNRPSPGSKTSDWWLRDVARCGRCGAKMSAAYGPEREGLERNYYYRCSKRCTRRLVRVRDAESACDPLVLARLVELREELSAPSAREPEGPSASALEERRARLARRRERYIEAFADGHIDRAQLKVKLEKLDEERTRLEAESAPRTPVSEEARRASLRDVAVLEKAWNSLGGERRRELVKGLVKQVFLAAGQAPRFEWMSASELAERVE
ncbi:MAG: recombinase family protein [Solirubrobacterales bacterium]|nr:recombinase family protein [Solirubrobacterales bacterium]